MFSNPIRIYGNYSRIAKKYSKDNSNEKAEPFVLIDVEGKKSIKAIKDICEKTNTKSIIVDFVYDVVINQIQPKIAFKQLWEKIEE